MTAGPSQPAEPPETGLDQVDAASGVREITDVETLKVLADPTRLAILATLMQGPARHPRLMTVKELAAEMREPQTKLYRHVKQLEAAGLIRAAASRVVSGILEQRYEASQRDLTFGPGLIRDKTAVDQFEAAVTEIINRYVSRFFAAYREGRIVTGDGERGDSMRRGLLQMAETRLTPARAKAIRAALQQIAEEVESGESESREQEPDDGVPVNVLIGFYSPAESPPG